MKIRYNGAATTRIIGPVTWTRAAPVQEVADAGLVAEALTQPGEAFEVDASDPLRIALGIDAESAARLVVMAGVVETATLAALDAPGIEGVAESVGAAIEVVREWQASARLVKPGANKAYRRGH